MTITDNTTTATPPEGLWLTGTLTDISPIMGKNGPLEGLLNATVKTSRKSFRVQLVETIRTPLGDQDMSEVFNRVRVGKDLEWRLELHASTNSGGYLNLQVIDAELL